MESLSIAKEQLLAHAEQESEAWLQELVTLARQQPLLFRRWAKSLRLRVWHNRQEHRKGHILKGSSHHATRQTGTEVCRKAQTELSVQVPLLRALKALNDAFHAEQPVGGRSKLIERKAEKVGLLVLARIAMDSPFMRQAVPRTNLGQRRLTVASWKEAALPLALPQWTDLVMDLDTPGQGLKSLQSQWKWAQERSRRRHLREKIMGLLQEQLSAEEKNLLTRVLN